MLNQFNNIYIINLPGHTGRKQRITDELISVGVDINKLIFIEAIHGSSLPDTKSLINEGILANTFIDPNGMVTKNIIACAMSHKMCYDHIISSGSECSLILEDDIVFSKTGLKALNNGAFNTIISNFKKSKYDVAFVGGVGDTIPVWEEESGMGLYEYRRYLPEWAAHAYVVKQSGAKALLENNTPIKHAADVNIECSNSTLGSLHRSYILQKGKLYERQTEQTLSAKFNKMLYGDEIIGEFTSTTTEGTANQSVESIMSTINQYYTTKEHDLFFKRDFSIANIQTALGIDYINFKEFTSGRGDLLENWTNIHFKS